MPDADPVADWVAAARERNEAYIEGQALTEWTVARMPSGDLRKALAALEAVRELLGDVYVMSASFEFETERREPVSWDLDPEAIREAIASKVLSKEEEPDGS